VYAYYHLAYYIPEASFLAESGSFTAQVANVYSNLVNATGDGTYNIPTAAQADDMGAAFGKIMAGDLAGAAALVNPYAHDVVKFTDTDVARDYVMIRERPSPTRFWGFYVWSLATAPTGMCVEAPHTKADIHTHTQGAALFVKANARAYLMSTTHRNSVTTTDAGGNKASDLANYTGNNPFQSVHAVAVQAPADVDPDAYAMQIHGFADATDPDYDIILSEGQASPSQRTQDLAADLRTGPGAFRVRVYDGTGVLSATPNVQGQQSRPLGVYWLHVEQNTTLRNSAVSRGIVEDAIVAENVTGVTGNLSGTLPAATGATSGAVTNTGQLGGSLPPASGTLAASASVAAHLAGTLPTLTGSLAAAVKADGALAATLPAPVGGITAQAATVGSIPVTLPTVTGILAGNTTVIGDLSGTLSALVGTFTGATVVGQLTVALPAITGGMAATLTTAGILTGVLPAARTTPPVLSGWPPLVGAPTVRRLAVVGAARTR